MVVVDVDVVVDVTVVVVVVVLDVVEVVVAVVVQINELPPPFQTAQKSLSSSAPLSQSAGS